MDIVGDTLVVAMASRLFAIYDIRKMDAPAQQRESSLKYMTRSLACMPDGEGEQLIIPPFFILVVGDGVSHPLHSYWIWLRNRGLVHFSML